MPTHKDQLLYESLPNAKRRRKEVSSTSNALLWGLMLHASKAKVHLFDSRVVATKGPTLSPIVFERLELSLKRNPTLFFSDMALTLRYF